MSRAMRAAPRPPGGARTGRGTRRAAVLAIVLVPLLLVTIGCDRILPDRPDLELPPIETIDSIYRANGVRPASVTYRGNVVELVATQSSDQLRRGGSLWARVGPQIYLLNPATRAVFETYEGVAAVRAITRTQSGEEIARATLLRTALNEASWPRAIRLMSAAVTEGTERPRAVEELVRFGEQRTEHEYNTRYVPPSR